MKNTIQILIIILSIGVVVPVSANKIGIAIHGGAGTIDREKFSAEEIEVYKSKLKEAADTGYKILEKGGDSTEAVIAAITILEDSPLFNAGSGAVYTYDGQHELDASIMQGGTRNAGAVAGVKHVQNPIKLARLVMDKSAHVMLAGQGAEEFALTHNMALVPNTAFDTEQRYAEFKHAKKLLLDKKSANDQAMWGQLPQEYRVGTVGAVALDKQGNLAAGTSTGGMTAKRYGRVGDSPVIGAGTWADNESCAVSATGHGEYFIRYHVAADICSRMKYQDIPVEKAANTVVNDILKDAGGSGGVIVIDKQGNITMPFNTKGMYRAYRTEGSEAVAEIFDEKTEAELDQ